MGIRHLLRKNPEGRKKLETLLISKEAGCETRTPKKEGRQGLVAGGLGGGEKRGEERSEK